MIMITGGCGFLGSHICRVLIKKNKPVLIVDNIDETRYAEIARIRLPDIYHKLQFISGDITDREALYSLVKKNGVKMIVHTAAISFIPDTVKNPIAAFRVNAEGTFNLLEASRQNDIKKFIYISSVSTYGDFVKIPADETHPLKPKDIYGSTKVAADWFTLAYHNVYNLPTCTVRTSSVYGPGELQKRVVKNFIENALLGKPIKLEGGGLIRRDFSYVKDVANGVVLALLSENSVGEAFNITGATDSSIKELAFLIKKYIPETDIIETEGRKLDLKRGELDITKAKEKLGYQPQYTLEEGLKEYIKWVADFYLPHCGLKVKNKPKF